MKSGLFASKLALCALVLLGALLPAAAPPVRGPSVGAKGAGKAGRVRVSVVVILASERDGKVHKKLICIADEVKKIHPKLKSFRLHTMSYKSLAVNVTDDFELVESQTTAITVQRSADKANRVCLKIAPPRMGEITYSTPCGKFLPIITPYRTKKGELLILAVRVEPCKGK